MFFLQRQAGKKGLHMSTFYKLINEYCPHIKKFKVNSGNCSMCAKMAANQATFNKFKPELETVVSSILVQIEVNTLFPTYCALDKSDCSRVNLNTPKIVFCY